MSLLIVGRTLIPTNEGLFFLCLFSINMPTKSKLPRNKIPPTKTNNKVDKPPEIQDASSTTISNSVPIKTASGLSIEAEDQFELELCWCIQQLEAGLADIKLNDKQVFNMTKSLNVLKSGNASLIKKRQVMRNTFGDYRAKMIDDEKKFSKTTSVVKFSSGSNKKGEKKSMFIKKASKNLNDKTEKCESSTEEEKGIRKAIINPDLSNEPFKFNFSNSDMTST